MAELSDLIHALLPRITFSLMKKALKKIFSYNTRIVCWSHLANSWATLFITVSC